MENLIFSPPVIAHRGASAYAPENTIAAFTKAIQLGAHWVEFDIQLTKLNEVVVFHDDSLFRIARINGKVKDYSYAFLQTLDAGIWFNPNFSQERIPSLKEALQFLFDKGMSVNIEFKPETHKEAELVNATLGIIKELTFKKGQICYSSFCLKTLNYLRSRDADCHIGILLRSITPNWLTLAANLRASTINLNEYKLTQKVVEEIKKHDYLVTSYTVNNPARAKQLLNFGVDAVFSDVPDIIIKNIEK